MTWELFFCLTAYLFDQAKAAVQQPQAKAAVIGEPAAD